MKNIKHEIERLTLQSMIDRKGHLIFCLEKTLLNLKYNHRKLKEKGSADYNQINMLKRLIWSCKAIIKREASMQKFLKDEMKDHVRRSRLYG